MKSKIVSLAALAALIGGCATSYHRGVVAMKVDGETAHVGINKEEVKVGDHVQLYGNKCTGGGRGNPRHCVKVSKGHGDVVEIIGDHYVSVKFEKGVEFNEGDFIEKHSH